MRRGLPMALDLRELIPIRTYPKQVEAQVFNRVRLALLRGAEPLYVEVARINLEFQLERDVWLGRSIINGAPIMAWTAFTPHRDALHEPVSCLLHLYHVQAGLVMGAALSAIDDTIKAHFAPHPIAAPQRPRPVY